MEDLDVELLGSYATKTTVIGVFFLSYGIPPDENAE